MVPLSRRRPRIDDSTQQLWPVILLLQKHPSASIYPQRFHPVIGNVQIVGSKLASVVLPIQPLPFPSSHRSAHNQRQQGRSPQLGTGTMSVTTQDQGASKVPPPIKYKYAQLASAISPVIMSVYPRSTSFYCTINY